MSGPVDLTLEDLCAVAVRLAAALDAAGDDAAAAVLEDAVEDSAEAPERLLGVRSALVLTRPRWQHLTDGSLVADARAAVAAGKRLAMDM